MKKPFSTREKQILDYLKKHNEASIQELAEALSVSKMTVHRDLNQLEKAGLLHKQHGGAILKETFANNEPNPCAMCGKSTVGRKVFILYLVSGEQKTTCCAHCGLMLLTTAKGVWQSMTMDFLHGHMVSTNQATYLIDCDLNICCVPTILTFGSRTEAERFQAGFGGKLASMDETIKAFFG